MTRTSISTRQEIYEMMELNCRISAHLALLQQQIRLSSFQDRSRERVNFEFRSLIETESFL